MDDLKQNDYVSGYLYNSLFLFFISLLIFFLIKPVTHFKNFQFFGFVFTFVSFIVAILFLIKYLQFKKGERGENIVNRILKKLNNYDLIRNIRIDNYGDIDHLLIYNNNIFVIETKHYSGDIEVNGDDWYVNGIKIKSPSIQIKKITAKFKELFGIKNWLDCLIIPITDGKLKVKNVTVNIIRPNELTLFINRRNGYIKNEFLFNLKNKIKILQLTQEDKISLKGLLDSWWFSNYKKFFILGVIYGLVYLINTDIFISIINRFYLDMGKYLPKYTLTEDILSIFYVGVLPLLFGKIIFDILKIDLKIQLLNIIAMAFMGYMPLFIYDLFIYSDSTIVYVAEIIARLIAILMSYYVLRIFKFKLKHIYLK